jgi:hypothetical protein
MVPVESVVLQGHRSHCERMGQPLSLLLAAAHIAVRSGLRRRVDGKLLDNEAHCRYGQTGLPGGGVPDYCLCVVL